jgi:hypothetical protein
MLGWELVSFASYTVGFGVGGNSSMKVHLRYVFKRPIDNLEPDFQAKANELSALYSRKAELVSEIEAHGYKAE